jgi:N-carbamoylputrescine amidase
VANGLPLVAANRVGFEPDPAGGAGALFWGNSFVAGPQGEILARAGDEEEVLVATIDRARSEAVRRIWPFLRDRRIDAYGDLLKRYRD